MLTCFLKCVATHIVHTLFSSSLIYLIWGRRISSTKWEIVKISRDFCAFFANSTYIDTWIRTWRIYGNAEHALDFTLIILLKKPSDWNVAACLARYHLLYIHSHPFWFDDRTCTKIDCLYILHLSLTWLIWTSWILEILTWVIDCVGRLTKLIHRWNI